jgi:hypothetical protein
MVTLVIGLGMGVVGVELPRHAQRAVAPPPPDAVFAAVASSAPVEARLDFVEYHDNVGIKHQH